VWPSYARGEEEALNDNAISLEKAACQQQQSNSNHRERDAHLTFVFVCCGRGVMEQFRVDINSIGMIIGKDGTNIKKAQALPGVHRIDIRQDGMISIVADTPQAGKEARAMLEVTQEKIKIQPHEVRIWGAWGKGLNWLVVLSLCAVQIGANPPLLDCGILLLSCDAA